MASEILDLANVRPDLGESQCTQLYFAGVRRFRELPGGQAGIASRDELYAWVDLVVPPPEGNAGDGTRLPPVIEAIIATDAGLLLLGPEPAVTAAPLAELARRRPDLSPVQRHELLVGARGQLRRPGFGHDIEASPDAIFAWIDVVAPVHKRCGTEDVLRPKGRPKGSRYVASREAVLEAFRRAKGHRDRNPSAIPSREAVAKELDVSVRALADFLSSNGIPWPPE